MSNNNLFREKADKLRHELKHTKVFPKNHVKFIEDNSCFQALGVEVCENVTLPLELKRDTPIILDFGRHCVGYLNYTLSNCGKRIVDSPVVLDFSFGEFPLEIVSSDKEYKGVLGNGWLQTKTEKTVFCPADVILDRRFSFRYVKITRKDTCISPLFITDMFADCVSAVDLSSAEKINIPDKALEKIYDISLNTLKECEQDVFEDGPKRDRRLWIGDLRLQALADYVSFKNTDLVKRCIYLFASKLIDDKMVGSCFFPDSPPCVDDWFFADYSLYFVSCLFDYAKNTRDYALPCELYHIAQQQIKEIFALYDSKTQTIKGNFFVDWCPELDKSVCGLAIFLYVLKQFKELSELLGKDCTDVYNYFDVVKSALLKRYSTEKGVFITDDGQISWHSQVWAVLSGVLTEKQSKNILDNLKTLKTEYTIRTPYMMHFYIEALYNNGQKAYAMQYIKEYWSKIVNFGFDCCPEIFNPNDHYESPYGDPQINSACHAWSCTPVYWISKYYNLEENQ